MRNSQMFYTVLYFTLLWSSASPTVYLYSRGNISRPTVGGISEYRSALTLDWLAAEDGRQRELAAAYETEGAAPARVVVSECVTYARPAPGKVARLMLELLRSLEGDDGVIINQLVQALVNSKLLVETSMLDAEPNLDALVKTPGVMMGEPHITFPRTMAMVWMSACDTSAMKRQGWCSIRKVTKYLSLTKSTAIAKHLRTLDPVIARARYIMEEFIQHVTPINIYEKKPYKFEKKVGVGKPNELAREIQQDKKPVRTTPFVRTPKILLAQTTTPTQLQILLADDYADTGQLSSAGAVAGVSQIMIAIVLFLQ